MVLPSSSSGSVPNPAASQLGSSSHACSERRRQKSSFGGRNKDALGGPNLAQNQNPETRFVELPKKEGHDMPGLLELSTQWHFGGIQLIPKNTFCSYFSLAYHRRLLDLVLMIFHCHTWILRILHVNLFQGMCQVEFGALNKKNSLIVYKWKLRFFKRKLDESEELYPFFISLKALNLFSKFSSIFNWLC